MANADSRRPPAFQTFAFMGREVLTEDKNHQPSSHPTCLYSHTKCIAPVYLGTLLPGCHLDLDLDLDLNVDLDLDHHNHHHHHRPARLSLGRLPPLALALALEALTLAVAVRESFPGEG